MKILPWIWKSYARRSLVPVLIGGSVLIGGFFISNQIVQVTNHTAMQDAAWERLKSSTSAEATIINLRLRNLAEGTDLLRLQSQRVLASPGTPQEVDTSNLAFSPGGAYYSTYDNGGPAIFYSGIVPIEENQRAKVKKLLPIGPALTESLEIDESVVQVYVSTHDTLGLIVPFIDVISMLPEKMDVQEFNFYYDADAKHNPERGTVWTDAYVDPNGYGWLASSLAPVYVNNFLEAVVGRDVTITNIINEVLDLKIPWGGYGLLLDRSGTIMALPPAGEIDWGLEELTEHDYSQMILEDSFKPDDFNISKRDDSAALAEALEASDSGLTRIDLNGSKLAAWETIPETGWRLLVLVPESQVFAVADELDSKITSIGVLMSSVLIGSFFLLFLMLYRGAKKVSETLSEPLQHIRLITQGIRDGKYDQTAPHFPVQELDETVADVVRTGEALGVETNRREEVEKLLLRAQKSLEQTVAERTARLRSIIDTALDGIVVFDAKFSIQDFSPAAETIFGRASSEVVGTSFLELIAPDCQGQIGDLVENLRNNPEMLSDDALCEVVGLHASKDSFPMELGIALAELDEEYFFTAIARDISDRKAAESALLEARNAAEKASQTKSAFLANMSHELRTPMNAIMGYSEMLMEEAEDIGQDDFVPDLKKINQAGSHLLALINDVLDLSKIESGKMEAFAEDINVNDLIDEVSGTVHPLVEKNNNELVIERGENLGDIHQDLTKLRQTLYNLFSNAAKFTNDGAITLRVERTKKSGVDWIVLSVTDSGIGIAEDKIDKVFEEFTQADGSTTRDFGGTGLGLAISRRFCRMLGGDLILTSKLGEGSTFTISLPAIFSEKN
ncbi:MAG: ATP-binding protein [bacterium]